jgi:hypothetical protein
VATQVNCGVAPTDETDALLAIQAVPGSSIVIADGPLNQPSPAPLPAGVSTHVPVLRFLQTLASRTEHRRGPDRAHDGALSQAVVGGFATEISGLSARVAAARERLEVAVTRHEDAESALRLAETRHTDATNRRKFAVDAARLRDLGAAAAAYESRIAEIDTSLAALEPTVENAHQQILRSTVAGRSRHEDHVNVQVTGLWASGKREIL